ncbi:MAG: serine/threonine protein kinase, AGC [Peltula sp. TS41687]|nr:MAG: serine/threonine protein kinase, AGC [Peltula sp. TS41687]
MATVAIQKPADVGRDSAFVGGGHSQSSTTSPTTKSSSSVGKESLKREEEEEVDEEKNHIAHVVGQKGNVLATPLPPSEIAKDPEEKDIGWSSKRLGLDDFELIRTLGTGTFARVWLVRLKDCAEKAGDQVYAMKVLRKADSAQDP